MSSFPASVHNGHGTSLLTVLYYIQSESLFSLASSSDEYPVTLIYPVWRAVYKEV